ncbi:MAG: sigma-70 family RNA polymerase sigma factor [Acidimicrobiales bacterium]
MEDVAGLVEAARTGDAAAWRALVDGHTGLVWSIVRGFRFDDDTARDVYQTVWLRLAEHLDRIREPARLAGWLGQTTRNECVGVVRQRSRIVLSDEPEQVRVGGEPVELGAWAEPGSRLERDETRAAVAAAFERLGERCQELLRLLVSDPPVSYELISEALGIPVGSIGPTRARCLQTLRSTPEISRISAGLRSS